MTSALLLGRKGSIGFPGKNTYPLFGKPMAFYPMDAARRSAHVDKVFLSTDDEQLMAVAEQNGVEVIVRPDYLCTKEALGEDAYKHGVKEIIKREGSQEMFVLLFCNAATIKAELIDEGIKALREHEEYDSAVTVSRYNMWSPLRARKVGSDGLLHPFVPFETFGDPKTLNCDRDSQGDVLFADMSASIVRQRCIDHMEDGLLPQKWMGRRIYPVQNEGGCDVDYEWQVPQVEYWLKKNGIVTDESYTTQKA